MTQRDLGALESKLTEWLDVSRLGEAPTQQIAGFIQHFQDAEIDLILCSSLIRTLHPQIEPFAQRWHPERLVSNRTAQTEHVLDHHSLQVDEGQSSSTRWRMVTATSPCTARARLRWLKRQEPVRWRRASVRHPGPIIDDLAAGSHRVPRNGASDR